ARRSEVRGSCSSRPARAGEFIGYGSVDEEAAGRLALVHVLLGLVVGVVEALRVVGERALVAVVHEQVGHVRDLRAVGVVGLALPGRAALQRHGVRVVADVDLGAADGAAGGAADAGATGTADLGLGLGGGDHGDGGDGCDRRQCGDRLGHARQHRGGTPVGWWSGVGRRYGRGATPSCTAGTHHASDRRRRLCPPRDARGYRSGVLVRPGEPADAAAIAAIYNEGIADRQATFETDERGAEDVLGWLGDGAPPLLVADDDGAVVAWARAGAYSDRC